ncbi:hypothetical protein GJAV_G00110730 [Gymnothorax javanicus]|nr:hypothetical protein GJAV_G00110730 [Gymnothorax javanicus]
MLKLLHQLESPPLKSRGRGRIRPIPFLSGDRRAALRYNSSRRQNNKTKGLWGKIRLVPTGSVLDETKGRSQGRKSSSEEEKMKQQEVENKKRQLEDKRRQLQHFKSKARRERWLLEGSPSAGVEGNVAQKQLQEDEAETRSLEQAILRLERELIELETGVPVTYTEHSLKEIRMVSPSRMTDSVKLTATESVKEVRVLSSPRMESLRHGSDMMKAAAYSVEITVEKDRLTGETKVLSTSTKLPKDLSQQAVKVYEDELKVVHEMRGMDSSLQNGVRLLSSSEVDELIHKAEAADAASLAGKVGMAEKKGVAAIVGVDEKEGSVEKVGVAVEGKAPPQGERREMAPPVGKGEDKALVKEITGLETKPTGGGDTPTAVGGATEENPVSMVFMGYQDVEDEAETKKVLGLKGTVKAELVHIGDCAAKDEPAPSNGSAAPEVKGQVVEAGAAMEPQAAEADPIGKKKRPCKCCVIM